VSRRTVRVCRLADGLRQERCAVDTLIHILVLFLQRRDKQTCHVVSSKLPAANSVLVCIWFRYFGVPFALNVVPT
jgi:hypothetical protein